MTNKTEIPLTVQAGASVPIAWALRQRNLAGDISAFDETDATFELIVVAGEVTINALSADGDLAVEVVEPAGEIPYLRVMWLPTAEETLSLPVGSTTRYALWWRDTDGQCFPHIVGQVTVEGEEPSSA